MEEIEKGGERLENFLEINKRGVGKSGRVAYIGFRESSLLFASNKTFCFLQNKNNHIKYNKEVIKFYLLSFFLVLVVRCRKFSPNLRN